ncbi:MAG: MBL fold metallo-hydrolase [Anaerolineae bacterium]|nr:MBL fold metallo-hydrolase [Anaerolineae bacterium]MDW8069059.1 MBL fold metallo-hydrolase [Anaerolineae bacterium]
MILQTLIVGLIQTNCYILGCEQTKEGIIIDPGGHPERILRAVQEADLTVRYVLNTHCHFDHMAANAEVVAATGASLAIHPAERPILDARGGAAWFGVSLPPSPPPDLELTDGQVLEVGTLRLQVLHTPGHSPGSVTFYLPDQGMAFDGDVLFAMGVGRTDLPGGNWDTLMRSIGEILFALPDETVLYPGHGPQTTVGQEKRFNPWLL